MGAAVQISGNATAVDVINCYRYILGREMNDEEKSFLTAVPASFAATEVNHLRRTFFQSAEFHSKYLETVFENLVPHSVVVKYRTMRGFDIYLDLRQLHMSFGVLNEIYEKREIELVCQIVGDESTFFDVGANCGYYALSVASRPGFRGQVIAFEPLEPLQRLLRRSIADNRLGDCVTLYTCALADKPGTMRLTDAEHSINAGATMLAFDGLPPDRATRAVEVETLDRVAGHMKPDVMKIDIQGAEGLFFRGAETTIMTHRPTLFFEVSPELLALLSKSTPGDLQRWLALRGYRLWKLQERELRPIPPYEDMGSLLGHTDLMDVLAVHDTRRPEIAARLGGLP